MYRFIIPNANFYNMICKIISFIFTNVNNKIYLTLKFLVPISINILFEHLLNHNELPL